MMKKAIFLSFSLLLSGGATAQEMVEPVDGGAEVIVIKGEASARDLATGGTASIAKAIATAGGSTGGTGGGKPVTLATTPVEKKQANEKSKAKKQKKPKIAKAAKGLADTIAQGLVDFYKSFNAVYYRRTEETVNPDGSSTTKECTYVQLGSVAASGESPCTLKIVTKSFNYLTNEEEFKAQIIPYDNVCSFYEPRFDGIQFSCEPEDTVAFYAKTFEELIQLLDEE
jgi:hypothetical protein